jgi:hypothetical protein
MFRCLRLQRPPFLSGIISLLTFLDGNNCQFMRSRGHHAWPGEDTGDFSEVVVLDIHERNLVFRPSMRQYGAFGLFSGPYILQAPGPGMQKAHFVERNCGEISKLVCLIVCFDLDSLFRYCNYSICVHKAIAGGGAAILGSTGGRLATPREYAPITAMAISDYMSRGSARSKQGSQNGLTGCKCSRRRYYGPRISATQAQIYAKSELRVECRRTLERVWLGSLCRNPKKLERCLNACLTPKRWTGIFTSSHCWQPLDCIIPRIILATRVCTPHVLKEFSTFQVDFPRRTRDDECESVPSHLGR